MSEKLVVYDAPADLARARAEIEADRERRVQAVTQRIKAALEEFKCRLVVEPQLTADGRVTAAVRIEVE